MPQPWLFMRRFSASSPITGGGGYRSMFAFWMGGATASTVVVIPPEPTPTPTPAQGGAGTVVGGGGSWLYREAYNELRRAIREARTRARGLTKRKKKALEEAARLAAEALELLNAEQEAENLRHLAELLTAATKARDSTIQEAQAAIEYAEGILDDEEVIELLLLH